MAASSELQIALKENPFGLKAVDSDSDSGQGSCELTSPMEKQEKMDFTENGDSDDEILVLKKSKNKKLFEESDSDAEVENSTIAASTGLELESDEEKKYETTESGKPRRIRAALLDSDDSNEDGELGVDSDKLKAINGSSDQDTQECTGSKKKKSSKSLRKIGLEEKPKEKSERRREKEKDMLRSLKKLKEGKRKSKPHEEESGMPLNDSGCLLADGDLFDKDDESDGEEESLDTIRANVKGKFKSIPSFEEGAEHEEELEERSDKYEKKKERKAARMSKEAIKQLHSETQRLLRESSVSLPYHLPEPKSIHEFFKRRSRPFCQGNAMQLIKSSKYLPCGGEDQVKGHLSEPAQDSCLPVERCNLDSQDPLQQSQTPIPDCLAAQIVPSAECQLLETKVIDTDHSERLSEVVCNEGASQTEFNSQNEEHSEEASTDSHENITVPEAESVACEPIKVTENICTGEPPAQDNPKLSKMKRLLALGVDLSIKPLLRPDDGTFVNLDEPKPNKELEALKERFLKHSLHKVKAVAEKKVNLHIVRKETTADGKEELKAEVVPVTVDAENLEGKIHVKPGEKLQVLKAKLQEAMKVRRTEERQKRQALFRLDNEDLDEEEEEEEMTESEDEEGVENGEANAECMEYLLGGDEEDEPKDQGLENSSVPDIQIAVPRPVATESTLMLFKDTSTKTDDSVSDKIDHADNECKDNEKLADEDDFLLPLTKDSHNSSFELIGSMIPSYQPFAKNGRGSLHAGSGGFRSPSPLHFKANFTSSASKSSGKMSEPSLPVEDSQDLYSASPEPKSSYLCPGVESQFHFSLDDTQSQLLDADGFLNVGHNRSKFSSAKQRLVMDTMDENAMDANMGELLDLCSGQFKESLSDASQPTENKPQKAAMDELLGLCSGKFVSQDDLNQDSLGSANVHADSEKDDIMSEAVALCSGTFTNRENEEQEDELGDFRLLPCDDLDEEEVSDCASEEEEEEEEGSGGADDDDEEMTILRKRGKKRKLNLQDFMEDEAELSGSDVGSEDEDEADEDEYEEDAIDEELPSDEELQDQVNKIHMKVTMDEDKRRLRLYQERYLADGDLHSDGPGRMRKFRWKNLDDASQFDMFRRDSDLEEQEGDNEDVDETDLKWRKERFEREQWLREQTKNGSLEKVEDEEDIGTDSQFMLLAKKVTQKTLQRRATVETKEPKPTTSKNPFEAIQPFSLPKMKTGSMLNMPKEVLQKLATMSNLNPNAPRNTRNFVFQTLSPQKKGDSVEKHKPKVRKNITAATPSPKRFRPNNATTTAASKSRSIFPLLEN